MMNKLASRLLRNSLITTLFALLAVPAIGQRGADPAVWNDTMDRFAEQDRMKPPPMGAILLTGSSSIARWNDHAAVALAPLTVIARGFGGSVMNDVLHHLDAVALQYKPRAILIYEGDNDTSYRIPESEIIGTLNKIVERVNKELPDTRIYVMAVKPSTLRVDVWENAKRVNAGYREIAKNNPQVHYVDSATPFLNADGSVMTDIFVEDGLHLNPMGNLIWGSVIRAALMPQEARYE
jgi:lysophospholipase L1-like esterase